MRTIEEIKADIRDCEACEKLRPLCKGDCNICDCIYSSNLPIFENELRHALVADIPFNRLEEICNAEREERCIMPPCRLGGKLWFIVTKNKGMKSEYSFVKQGYLCESNFFSVLKNYGKTVFLTRKTADQALKEATPHDT